MRVLKHAFYAASTFGLLAVVVGTVSAQGPRVTNMTPSGAVSREDVTAVVLTFSEALDPVPAMDTNSYELLALGPDRVAGGGDDSILPVTAQYTAGETQVTLTLNSVLSEGAYRVTVRAWSEGVGVQDSDGNPLDQNQDGSPDDYAAHFEIDTTAMRVSAVDVGSCLALEDSRQYVSLPHEVLDGLDDFTVECWFKTGESEEQAILSAANAGQANEFCFRLQGDAVRLWVKGIEVQWTVPGITDDRWHHAAVVHDHSADSVTVFIDGNAEGERTVAAVAPLDVATGGLYLGQDQDSVGGGFESHQAFQGHLADLAVWQIPRAAGDIASGMHQRLTGGEAGLVGYWTCDDGIGSVLTDISAGAYHGALGCFEPCDARFRAACTAPIPRRTFRLTIEDATPDPAQLSNPVHYSITASGGDGTFADGNETTHEGDDLTGVDVRTDPPYTVVLRLGDWLPQDHYEVAVSGSSGLTDRAGNAFNEGADYVSGALPLAIVNATMTAALQEGSDTGMAQDDGLTADNTPTYDLTVNKRGMVGADLDGDGVRDVEEPAPGAGTVPLTLPALTDGTQVITFQFDPWVGSRVTSDLEVTIDTAGPRAIGVSQDAHPPYGKHWMRFSEPIQEESFTVDDTRLEGPGGTDLGRVRDIKSYVSQYGDRYRLVFDSVTEIGSYALTIGPDIVDRAGNQMDQNQDGVNGQAGDNFTDSFTIEVDLGPGLYVTDVIPAGDADNPFGSLEVVFSRAVEPGTFTAQDMELYPAGGGLLYPSGIAGLDPLRFAVDFGAATGTENYMLHIGPGILSAAGGEKMDQDHNGTAGEHPGDVYELALFGRGTDINSSIADDEGMDLLFGAGESTISGSHRFGKMTVWTHGHVRTVDLPLEVSDLCLGGGETLPGLQDGGTLTVAGGTTVEVEGTLTVAGESRLIMASVNTDAQVGGEWVGAGGAVEATDVYVGSLAAISADGQGYLPDAGPGGGPHYMTDGSHGGGGVVGDMPTYGDALQPVDLGSGGGVDYGGGAIHLVVSGTLTVNGEVTADASHVAATGSRGGAAGGSIWIETSSLAGSGSITADGGMGSNSEHGGGGGRIAIYFEDSSGFTDFDTVHADGGVDAAEDGTVVLLDISGGQQNLLVTERIDFDEDSALRYDNVTITSSGVLELGGGTSLLVNDTLRLSDGGILVCQGKNTAAQVGDEWAGAGVSVTASAVIVDAGCRITADGQGYLPDAGPGGGPHYMTDGSHGGGGVVGDMPTYGDALQPVDLGSGGGVDYGGGAIHLVVSGTLTVNGEVTADASHVAATGSRGGAAGGSIWIETSSLAGSGSITADGGMGSNSEHGGGGGRIAIYFEDSSGFTDFDTVHADGGVDAAEDGTVVLLDISGGQQNLLVTERIDFDEDSALRYDNVTITSSGVLELGGGTTLTVKETLHLEEAASLICRGKNTGALIDGEWQGEGVKIDARNLTVDAGCTIDADGEGYDRGLGPGAPSAADDYYSGGSHGGLGTGGAGSVYGSTLQPVNLGSGGGGRYGGWTRGGGAIELTIEKTITLDGEISADGISGGDGNTAGGAGGSVWIECDTLQGAGSISTDGSLGSNGAGGGGRIAIHYRDMTGFADVDTIHANGGGDAARGTVVLMNISGGGRNLRVTDRLYFAEDADLHYDNVTVEADGLLELRGGSKLAVDETLHVTQNGSILCHGRDADYQVRGEWRGQGVVVRAGNLVVDAGCIIDANGQGYGRGLGPGAPSAADDYHSGGSHGGLGTGGAGPVYGSELFPVALGWGGGGKYGGWTRGGGAVHLFVDDTLALDGEISADGISGGDGNTAGGAGGSVLIGCGTLQGTGSISADGSLGSNGAGGGGRVAVHYWDAVTLPLDNVTAKGGSETADDGTVVTDDSPRIRWRNQRALYHDLAELSWAVYGADGMAGWVDIESFGDHGSGVVGGRLPVFGSTAWNTLQVPDGRYDLRLSVYGPDGTHVLNDIRSVVVNNTIGWHGGVVTANETWTADRVHVVEETLYIPQGVTVTVSPGVIVKAALYQGLVVEGGGTLVLQGSETEPVTFTAFSDDSAGGDTNLDGGATVPRPGDWQGIRVEGGQLTATDHVDYRYLVTEHSGPLDGSASWLGRHVHRVTGDVFVGTDAFPDSTLVINPGAVVKFDPGTRIVVARDGSLVARGSISQPVAFTSIRDDSWGGDTNEDGDETVPSPGDWHNIRVTDRGRAELEHARVRYGGAQTPELAPAMIVATDDSHILVSSSVIEHSLREGVVVNDGYVKLVNTVLRDAERGLSSFGGIAEAVNCTFDQHAETIWGHGGTCRVLNSIIANSRELGVRDVPGVTVQYSNVWAPPHAGYRNYSGSDQTGLDGNVSVDPAFRDAEHGNYQLAFLSPMIDAADGSDAQTPATDVLGVPRTNDPRTSTPTGIPDAQGAYPDMGAFEFAEEAQSAINLVAGRVSGPSRAFAGTAVEVSWTVTNLGEDTLSGSWHDTIALISAFDTGPVGELHVVDVLSAGVLGPGESKEFTATVNMPAGTEGNWTWQVHANSRGEVFEGRRAGDNVATGAAPMSLLMPPLEVGESVSATFDETGDVHGWTVTVPARDDVIIELNTARSDVVTELYVGREYWPSRSSFTHRSKEWNSDDTSVLIPGGARATYYVMARARKVSGVPCSFTVGARRLTFELGGVKPEVAGTDGPVTLRLDGGQLGADLTYDVEDGAGNVTTATAVFVESSSRVYVTFNLAGLQPGTASIQARAGERVVELPDVLTVLDGAPGVLDVHLVTPRGIRLGRTGRLSIHYRNAGHTDVAVPLLTLDTDNGLLWRAQDDIGHAHDVVQFLAISPGGPAGVLPPGTGRSVPLKLKPERGGQAVVTVYRLDGDGEAVGWDDYSGELRPVLVPPDAWSHLFALIREDVGETTGSLMNWTRRTATLLSECGDRTDDPSQVLSLSFQNAENAFWGDFLIAGRDLACRTGDRLALNFYRGYQQPLSDRFRMGPLGRGWDHIWNIRLVEDDAGNVTVVAPGMRRQFMKSSAKGWHYDAAPADHGTLTRLGNQFTLREPNGLTWTFSVDGKLQQVAANSGETVSASYAGGNLHALDHNNGDRLEFDYNGNGTIRALILTTGTESHVATFGYDASGEHLVTAEGPFGTRRYAYSKSTGVKAHALEEVTFADGSHIWFEFDARGRVSHYYRDGGVKSYTYTYPGDNVMAVTDPRGTSTQFHYNSGLSRVRKFVAGSYGLEYDYFPTGLPRRVGVEDRFDWTYKHDIRNHLTGSVDPARNVFQVEYRPDSHLVANFRHPAGHRTHFSYDERGVLESITYPDGLQTTLSVNQSGRITGRILRDGTQLEFGYNTRGLLNRVGPVSQPRTTFRYDEAGNPERLANPWGAITMIPDERNRIEKIVFPSGRWLSYTFGDDNQRLTMTDDTGFAISYHYDDSGNLEAIRDGADNLVVKYTYNDMGQIREKRAGNGTHTVYVYDALSRPRVIIHYAPDGTVNSRFSYEYDALDRRISMETPEGTWHCAYDNIDRLTSVQLPDGRTIAYHYDGYERRTAVIDDDVRTDYVPNVLNGYSRVGDWVRTYDRNGNLVRRTNGSETWNYEYDADGRLATVDGPASTWRYEYDAAGTRVAVERDGIRTHYVVNPFAGPNSVVAEYDDSGTLIARYVHGMGLACRIDGVTGGRYYYDFDVMGSTVGLTGPDGRYVNTYRYLPFGEPLIKTEAVPNPFQYIGRFGVMRDGNGLDYMRMRYYQPTRGQFLRADPSRIHTLELYAYAGNNPLMYIDPFGLDKAFFRGMRQRARFASTDFQGMSNAEAEQVQNLMYGQQQNIVEGAAEMNEDYIKDLVDPSRAIPKAGDFIGVAKDLNSLHVYARCGGLGKAPHHQQKRPKKSSGKPGFCECVKAMWRDLRGEEQLFDTVPVPESSDPNDKLTVGTEPEGWISRNQEILYTIRFENRPTATAAAQRVAVTDQLDAELLDLSTFELMDLGFNHVEVAVPDGLQVYQEYDLNVATDPFPVRLRAELDPETAIATWIIESYDPATGDLPDDPWAGFLPPNNETHDGEGFVRFKIRSRTGAATGAELLNRARIVFDVNAPIETNQVSNLVDAEAPQSDILDVRKTGDGTDILVTAGGSDAAGSGIDSYDFYITRNGGARELWTTQAVSDMVFRAQPGHAYGFSVRARDVVGHTEVLARDTGTEILVADWVFPFALTGAAEPRLYIALDSRATPGFDPGLDEQTGVALRAAGAAALVEEDPQMGSVKLRYDAQPPAETVVWLLEAIPKDIPIELDWDAAEVPEQRHLWLARLDTAGEPVPESFIDAEQETTAVIGSASEWLVTLSDTKTVRLDLGRGWTLAALPVEPDNPVPDAIFGIREDGAGIWSWPRGQRNGTYARPSALHVCQGCWVYSSQDRSLLVSGVEPETNTVRLYPGWNLIGVVKASSMPQRVELQGWAWTWRTRPDRGGFYRAVKSLEPGVGYWVYWGGQTDAVVTFP